MRMVALRASAAYRNTLISVIQKKSLRVSPSGSAAQSGRDGSNKHSSSATIGIVLLSVFPLVSFG